MRRDSQTAAIRARAGRTWSAAQWLRCALLLVGALVASEAKGHNLGDSYLYLQIYEDRVTGRFEIALSDLNPALGLAGTEREITAENFGERIDFLKDYYLDHVTISSAGRPVSIRFTEHEIPNASGGYALLRFDLEGLDEVPETLTFDYSVLFDEDPDHRGFVLIEHNWATGTFANENQFSAVFSPGSRRQELDLTSSGRLRGMLALLRFGAEHVWKGLDHLVFLFALLLTAVLRREDQTWKAAEKFGPALARLTGIVVTLLLAHALALTLMGLGLVRLPEAVVETAIAASITLVALNVLRPLIGKPSLWAVFVLGLFHGFGFAGALLNLGVLDEHFGLAIFAYNLGIEFGQVVVVAVLFPALFLIRRWTPYRKFAVPAAALGMILVSGVWVAERGFGADVPMRELLPEPVQRILP